MSAPTDDTGPDRMPMWPTLIDVGLMPTSEAVLPGAGAAPGAPGEAPGAPGALGAPGADGAPGALGPPAAGPPAAGALAAPLALALRAAAGEGDAEDDPLAAGVAAPEAGTAPGLAPPAWGAAAGFSAAGPLDGVEDCASP